MKRRDKENDGEKLEKGNDTVHTNESNDIYIYNITRFIWEDTDINLIAVDHCHWCGMGLSLSASHHD